MHYLSTATLVTPTLLLLSALPGYAATFTGALNDDVRKFNPGSSVADIIGSGAASVSFGDTSIYIGTYQKNAIDQDPIIASITNGALDWIRADYDQSSPDARGEGLVWDTDNNNLYGLFTITGGSNESVNKFTDFTTGDSWLGGYGAGGGAATSVLLKLNPDGGDGIAGNATYIRSQLSSGSTNTVTPRSPGLELTDNYITFLGNSFFSPLRADGVTRMQRNNPATGTSPFDYQVVFNLGLTEACNAQAVDFDGVNSITAPENLELAATD